MRKATRARVIALAAAGALTVTLTPQLAAAVDPVPTRRLERAVTVGGILEHERVFQRIANRNDGTRAAGTPGYAASAAYVQRRLERAGYRVRQQQFTFPFFAELAPAEAEQVSPTPTDYQVATMQYSGSDDVTGRLVPIAPQIPPPAAPGTTTSGCDAADFPDPGAEPAVALIQRGSCTFGVKAANAEAAGYDAVIIFNEGQEGRTELLEGVTLGEPVGIPAVGMSFDDGAALVEQSEEGPVVVRVATLTEADLEAKTTNVIATSRTGNRNRTIVVGAHLDSVLEGPGINDNGSGAATILEIAEEMAELGIKPRQRLRFAFWGAEESGLLGSEHYVDSLTDTQLAQVKANLNFDMVGSPNFVRFVYDGDGSDTDVTGPPGSAQIEQIFTRYFAGRGLPSAPSEFTGRSDYGPFIAVGIPAGGLFTGAEGVKTEEQAELFGGTAGVAYDPCYHQGCDDIGNVNTTALSQMSDAAAHATMTLAMTRSGFFEDGSMRKSPRRSQFDYWGSHAVR